VAPKRKQQSDELPEIYEGGILVTPERRAYLESLRNQPIDEEADE
jgi:hypothetical protein